MRADPNTRPGGSGGRSAPAAGLRTNALSIASKARLRPNQVSMPTLIQAPSAVPSATPATPR